jgi:hypothetical protein
MMREKVRPDGSFVSSIVAVCPKIDGKFISRESNYAHLDEVNAKRVLSRS